MRLSKRRRPTRAAMDMTPMIDIVFLLLIFFMTVSQVSEINKERLELPQLKGSEDQQPTTVTVNVTEAGAIVVSGNELSMPELVALVGDQLGSVGDDPSRLTIVLRADRRGTSRAVNEVITRLSQLGVTQVRIAVEQQE
jgi:biopolymer transport protein ExbD